MTFNPILRVNSVVSAIVVADLEIHLAMGVQVGKLHHLTVG